MSARLIVIIVLLVLLQLVSCVPVSSFAVKVYDHGFAKQISWTQKGHVNSANKTSSFTQDDPFVYAYVTAALYSANFTWQWYDPTDQLYTSRTDQVECAVAPCTFVYYFPMKDTPASMRFGLWRMDLLVDGFLLYSDRFSVTSVITQENYWHFTVMQSAPLRVHGNLTVIIHPNNGTWSSYSLYMPYATNVTAFESGSNHTLEVSTDNSTLVVVDLGSARSDGYSFVLNFDLRYGLLSLNGWNGVTFALTWQDYAWGRLYNLHPIPETFNIILPDGATLVDTIGINVMVLNHNLTAGRQPSVSLATTVPPLQRFGWTVIYRDFTWRDSHINALPSNPQWGLSFASAQSIPVLPLTLGSVSLWSAIMSVFLLTGSELLSPIYAGTGILMNRRRLRIAALILVTIFLVTTTYQLVISQYSVLTPTR